jgi:two-component system response regulator AtoC
MIALTGRTEPNGVGASRPFDAEPYEGAADRLIEEIHRAYARTRALNAFLSGCLTRLLGFTQGRCALLVLGQDRDAIASIGVSQPQADAVAALIVSRDWGSGLDGVQALGDVLRRQLADEWTSACAGTLLLVPVLNAARLSGALLLDTGHKGALNAAEGEQLLHIVNHIVRLVRRLQFSRWAQSMGYHVQLIGRSATFLQVEHLIEQFAHSRCPVLIGGETGTGKESAALMLHFRSIRKEGPFISVNCGAFTSDDLLASELFGHVRGAFTTAHASKRGKLELAHRGTLFLDEVACMRPAMQVLLLRTLRYGDLQKVGDEMTHRTVDVRFAAACNDDLRGLVVRGDFREDLYSRLAVAHITMPPLRTRPEDIALLVDYYLCKVAAEEAGAEKVMTANAMAVLEAYPWPDNIAGLENALRYAYLVSSGTRVDIEHLPTELRQCVATRSHTPPSDEGLHRPDQFLPLCAAMEDFERRYLSRALAATHWNVSLTARHLGMTRQGLQKKMRRYDLSRGGLQEHRRGGHDGQITCEERQ